MSGQMEQTAALIAHALHHGGSAEVVEARASLGAAIHYMEVDGKAVEVPKQEKMPMPAVRVTHRDGSIGLHLMRTRESADNVLARAKELTGA